MIYGYYGRTSPCTFKFISFANIRSHEERRCDVAVIHRPDFSVVTPMPTYTLGYLVELHAYVAPRISCSACPRALRFFFWGVFFFGELCDCLSTQDPFCRVHPQTMPGREDLLAIYFVRENHAQVDRAYPCMFEGTETQNSSSSYLEGEYMIDKRGKNRKQPNS